MDGISILNAKSGPCRTPIPEYEEAKQWLNGLGRRIKTLEKIKDSRNEKGQKEIGEVLEKGNKTANYLRKLSKNIPDSYWNKNKVLKGK